MNCKECYKHPSGQYVKRIMRLSFYVGSVVQVELAVEGMVYLGISGNRDGQLACRSALKDIAGNPLTTKMEQHER